MRKILGIFIVLIAVACQQSANNPSDQPLITKSDDARVKDKGPLGPVSDVSQLTFREGFMPQPDLLLAGAWVSQCYSQSILPHIPFASHLQFYRMFYLFYPASTAGNALVQHFVREYQDPLCKDNFAGPFDPHSRQSVEIRGFYRVSDQSNLFPNVIQVSFEWTQCSGACQNPQNPIDGIYLNQVKLSAFRESEEGRQVLFWGANQRARFDSSTPFMPDQWFQWNIPFYRMPF